jgi:hypothetical protein
MIKLANLLFIKEMALSTSSEADKFAKEFAAFPTYSQIRDHISANYKRIGAGTARIVYDLGNYVVKLAANKHHSRQNENEIIEKQDCLDDKFFTKIYAYDKNEYNWIIAEKVKSFRNDEEIKKLIIEKLEGSDWLDTEVDLYDGDSNVVIGTGTKRDLSPDDFFDSFGRYLQYMFEEEEYEKLKRNPWLDELMEEVEKCRINPLDFHAKNWGMRDNGDLVVLDYGF